MTFRAFFIGLLLLIITVIAIGYNDYVYGNTYLSGGNHFPTIAIAIVVVFSLALNPLLRLVRAAWSFTQSEIIVIWCIMAAGVGIPASGLMRYMLPFMVAPFYFSSTDSAWAKAFYDHIPQWLVPSKDPNSPVVTAFYEGIGKGDSIPYYEWLVPFFTWGVGLMAAYGMMFCLTAIIRKQWVEHERLTFPLAQIPLEITSPPDRGKALNSLFRSPLMWLGAGIPIFFWGIAGIHHFYTWFPFIDNNSWTIVGLFNQMKGWRGATNFFFMPIGVSFLLSTEVSLSLWFFFILNNVQSIMRTSMGYAGTTYQTNQQLGGYFAFAAVAIWTMRHHLKDVFRKAFFNAKDVDDSKEAMSYRTSVVGLLLSSVVLIGWLRLLGAPVHVSFLFILIVWIILLVLSRFVAQCGLLLVQTAPGGPLGALRSFLGDKMITSKGMTALTFHQAALYGDAREVMMPTLLNNTRMGERKVNLKMLFLAMMAAVFISYTVAYFSQITIYYENGAANINGWSTQKYPKTTLEQLATAIKDPVGPLQEPGTLKHITVGGIAVLLVYLARSRFTWWFIHPIGMLTAQTYPMQHLWISIMIGWLCKVLAQKYARGELMTKIRYLFIGIIIGDALITIFWSLLGLCIGQGIGLRTFPG